MSIYIPLRRRSFLSKLWYAPRLFRSHYRLMRKYSVAVLEALKAAAILTANIFAKEQKR
jgi:hypothetical protein